MFAEYVKEKYGKDIERCSDKQLYAALLKMVNEMAAKKEKTEGKKTYDFGGSVGKMAACVY